LDNRMHLFPARAVDESSKSLETLLNDSAWFHK
jgi:hypothetical protein